MPAAALLIGAVVTSVCTVGVVVFLTRWLVVSEKSYPRETFPVMPTDRFRGVMLGIAVGIVWCVCDFLLNHLWGRPDWDLQSWELRFAVGVLFIICGRMTCTEIFRVIRCSRNGPPPPG